MDVKARKSRFRKYTLMFFIVSILLMVVSGVLGSKNANDIYGENAESTYSNDEFYIDTEDGNKLKQAQKSDKEEKCYSTEAVKQFTVVGKYLIYCTDKGKDSKLIRYDLESQKSKKLAENIQKFYAGQEIYAQNGTQIVSISYDGKNIVSKVKDAIMIKYKAKKIYFLKTKEEDGSLKFEKKRKGYQVYEYDTETGKESEKDVVRKIEVQE